MSGFLTRREALAAAGGLVVSACSSGPTIEFTRVPPADNGGPDTMDVIEGRVKGAKPGQQIVVFAHSEVWWAEPRLGRLFTPIQADLTWKTPTHLGTDYAAALVEAGYRPPFTSDALPKEGGPVIAIATIKGAAASKPTHRTLRFSGYEWIVRESPGERGGYNLYDPSNAWTTPDGTLHMRLSGSGGKWSCAQIILNRSLGYGTYRLTVRDTSALDPAAVFAMYTLSDAGAAAAVRNPREWDVEISRWGDPAGKNARYLLQPAYLGQNTVWFSAPAEVLIHEIRWAAGSVHMTTMDKEGTMIAGHVFSSGIPVPGDERFRINLYDFQRGSNLVQHGAEIAVDRFEYLP